MPIPVLPETTFPPLPADTSAIPQPSYVVTVGASPYTYKATTRQSAYVSGGAISLLQYGRGAVSIGLAILSTGQMVEMNPGDTIKISWALTAPTLTIFPR